MGRITPSFRIVFKEILRDLRDYSRALMDLARRDAFNSLVKAWSSELGAMSYARIPAALDAMLLTGVVDNRKLIMELQKQVKTLESKLQRLMGLF